MVETDQQCAEEEIVHCFYFGFKISKSANYLPIIVRIYKGPRGSMSYVVGLPNNSYKPITNTAWVRARLCKLKKRVHSTRSRK
jgi:hypothetical protein